VYFIDSEIGKRGAADDGAILVDGRLEIGKGLIECAGSRGERNGFGAVQRLRVAQEVADQGFHAMGGLHGDVEEIVGGGIEFSFVAALEHLAVDGDHAEGFTKVVGSGISELFEIEIGAVEFLIRTANLLFGQFALGDIGNDANDTTYTAIFGGKGGGALFKPGECTGIGAVYAELGVVRTAFARNTGNLIAMSRPVVGVNEAEAVAGRRQNGAENASHVADSIDPILDRIPFPRRTSERPRWREQAALR